MWTDYVKWFKWVGLYLIWMAFPVMLIILGTTHADVVPGILIGIALYFAVFRNKGRGKPERGETGAANEE